MKKLNKNQLQAALEKLNSLNTELEGILEAACGSKRPSIFSNGYDEVLRAQANIDNAVELLKNAVDYAK